MSLDSKSTGGLLAEGAVEPHAVVKDLDVLEDGSAGLLSGEEVGAVDPFGNVPTAGGTVTVI